MKTLTLLGALLVAAALAGCGGDDSASDPVAAVSIEEALGAGSDEVQLVSGNLLALGEEIRLCSALAESFPPQCGGASLLVDGLSLGDVDGLVTEGEVSWTDRPVELLGVVADGTLMVSENAPS
jgi:hypothetical protein